MPPSLNLLLFNLVTDADAPGQGFNTAWINALAARCASVDVLTMQMGRLALAENVRAFSVGREKGYSEPRRLWEFYRILNHLLREKHYDACFAHMQPLFTVLAAPLLLPRRIPITLWYAHKAVTPKLWLAEKVARHIVTSSPDGFRLKSQKVQIVGQGIDTGLFTIDSNHPLPDPPPYTGEGEMQVRRSISPPLPVMKKEREPKVRRGEDFTLLSVSRIAPIKRLEVMIEAARLLRDQYGWKDFKLRIVGNVYERDQAYAEGLQKQAREAGLDALVSFDGAINQRDLPQVYRAADVFINLSATGSMDKAVLEAMACGVPVITANEAYRDMLAQWADTVLIPPDDAAALAGKIAALAGKSPEERAALGLELRAIVVRDHSLERLADKLISIFQSGGMREDSAG